MVLVYSEFMYLLPWRWLEINARSWRSMLCVARQLRLKEALSFWRVRKEALLLLQDLVGERERVINDVTMVTSLGYLVG